MIEENLLSACMKSEQTFARVCSIITMSDFSEHDYQALFSSMQDYYLGRDRDTKHDISDLVLHIVRKTNISSSLVSRIAHLDSSALNAPNYAKAVVEQSGRRKLGDMCWKLSERINDQKTPLEDICAEIHDSVLKISQRETQRDTVKLLDELLQDFLEKCADTESDPMSKGVTTGFKHVDQMIGCIEKGALAVVAAPTSVGKTAFALNVAEHVAFTLKKRVDIFTLEMTKDEIFERVLTTLSGVPNLKKRTMAELVRIGSAQQKLFIEHKDLFLIHDEAAQTPRSIRQKLIETNLYHKAEMGLIVVDYIGLVNSGHKFATRNDEVGFVTRELKKLAKDFNVPVLALSQLNRSREATNRKELRASDLRDSGSVEQDANIIIMINRDMDSDHPELTTGNVIKNRNGEKGKFDLYYYGGTYKFTSLPTPKTPSLQSNSYTPYKD